MFFIGSRHATDCIIEELTKAVERHITEYDVTTFTVGHYGSFDRLVTRVLTEIKKQHANIKLYILAPYALNQNREAPDIFNGTFYPEGPRICA